MVTALAAPVPCGVAGVATTALRSGCGGGVLQQLRERRRYVQIVQSQGPLADIYQAMLCSDIFRSSGGTSRLSDTCHYLNGSYNLPSVERRNQSTVVGFIALVTI